MLWWLHIAEMMGSLIDGLDFLRFSKVPCSPLYYST